MGPAPTEVFNERAAFEAEQRAETERAGAAGLPGAGVVEGMPAQFQQSQPSQSPPNLQEGMQRPHDQPSFPPSQGAPYHEASMQQQEHLQSPRPSYAATQAAPQPIPGIPIRGPTHSPPPGHVITSYQIVQPQDGCSCDLKVEGWLVVLILLLLVPCVACVPCCLPDCFQTYQVPVYGPPGSAPPSVPIATPVYN